MMDVIQGLALLLFVVATIAFFAWVAYLVIYKKVAASEPRTAVTQVSGAGMG
jgi:hypothetical protein